MKWTPLTVRYSRWLFPLINREGYGLKWNGEPKHANKQEEIISYRYRMRDRKRYLAKFTKKHLQKHVDKEVVFYFTGGWNKNVLVMIDIDTHEGQLGGMEFAQCVLKALPGSYCQPSTNNRGFHIYIILDTMGYKPETVNMFYVRFQDWLRQMAQGYDISGVEVKGYIQHALPKQNWYCGLLAKVPLITSEEELKAIEQTPVFGITELLSQMKQTTVLLKEREKREREQLILVSQIRGNDEGKASELKELSSKKVCAKKTIPQNTSRRKKVLWQFVKEEGYVPDLDEALTFIRINNHYSAPWEHNEAKRAKDVAKILEDIRAKHKPERACRNYNNDAKRLLEGHDITVKGRRIDWQDLSIYLSILETCICKDPNANGSVPRDRVESLWASTARRKHMKRKWSNEKYPVMRDFLIAQGYLTMVDEEYATGKAMRYTIGPKHPDYGTIKRIVQTERENLTDGYLLERFKDAA